MIRDIFSINGLKTIKFISNKLRLWIMLNHLNKPKNIKKLIYVRFRSLNSKISYSHSLKNKGICSGNHMEFTVKNEYIANL